SDIRRNKDHLATNEQLKALLASHQQPPIRFKQIFNDATPAAIKDYLCGYWRSIGIMSDEAGTIFNGYTLNELPFINKMWDGATFSVERKSE
ncbi:YfjI family protein, partial [Escherichia coli]|nr:YfjI family protein [Escherichia coli]